MILEDNVLMVLIINVYIRIICLTSRNNKSLNNSLFNSWDSEVTIPGTSIKHLNFQVLDIY